MVEFDNVVRTFLVEASEILQRIERNLIALEDNPANEELLADVFRCVHTVKGSGGFLGFAKLKSVAHAGEGVLSQLRERRLSMTPEITSALLTMLDALRQMIASIETGKSEGDKDYAALIRALEGLQETSAPAKAAAAAPPEADAVSIQRHPVVDRTIRVDVDLLDKLMTVVGELVLLRNQMFQLTAAATESPFLRPCQHLNILTTELQEGIMKARLLPIRSVWDRLPRLVRDLSAACGKRVRRKMVGEETELDKSIIEAISDPLLHLVRNAIDHGFESPEEREAAGKPAEGLLLVRAYHEAGQVHLEVSDDGAGLRTDRIRTRAMQMGLVPAERIGRMDEREVAQLIFHRGLSTAEKVSEISGRGVGMDVVKANIERIGGTIEVSSTPGRGVTIAMKIPLTLAIIPALIVSVGGRPYAIPRGNVQELVSLDAEQAKKGIETLHSVPVYRLRNTLLPLVHLESVLQLAAQERPAKATINIVVLQADGHPFGLVVDDISDVQEIVVKPLGKHLKGVTLFGGATILGNGRVALILDVLGIAKKSNAVREGRELARPASAPVATPAGELQTYLLLQGPDDGRLAVRLSTVTRLEEFPRESVERVGSRMVVQYGEDILPLIPVSSALAERRTRPRRAEAASAAGADARLQVIVYRQAERQVGLVVDLVLDIVEERVTLQKAVPRRGVLGSAVIRNRVTELLDVDGIIRTYEEAHRS